MYAANNFCHEYNTSYCNQLRVPKHGLTLREIGVLQATAD